MGEEPLLPKPHGAVEYGGGGVFSPHASPRLVSPLPLLSLLKQGDSRRKSPLRSRPPPQGHQPDQMPPALKQPVQGGGESPAHQLRGLLDLFCNSWMGGVWGLDPRGWVVEEHELPAGSRICRWGTSTEPQQQGGPQSPPPPWAAEGPSLLGGPDGSAMIQGRSVGEGARGCRGHPSPHSHSLWGTETCSSWGSAWPGRGERDAGVGAIAAMPPSDPARSRREAAALFLLLSCCRKNLCWASERLSREAINPALPDLQAAPFPPSLARRSRGSSSAKGWRTTGPPTLPSSSLSPSKAPMALRVLPKSPKPVLPPGSQGVGWSSISLSWCP